MDPAKGSLLLVTEQTPQASLFARHLESVTSLKTVIVTPEIVTAKRLDMPHVVLIDLDVVDGNGLQQWQDLAAGGDEMMMLAAFNVRDEAHATETLSFVHLRGIFYRNDDIELICKGILHVYQGHLWMSRSLTSQLIEFFRQQQINTYRPAGNLTQREREIIGLMGSGATNQEIAERLFLSEHTVKSHIYNIFKKINVHNRTQAVNWARSKLGAPPPLASFNRRASR
ncbi:response regulator transcription factor [Halomonas urumqiensis]|uniref:Helix-turn-helix transcriptional regulator n=1 Tax=Halomonas urumqiensis TaxID=1684789 RepID=A0A2N7UK28_9GAMM|nr:response regulator transcription factor [Halomonas urumqiensis]PMR80786.1 helix-turn-helix transcriptional regulator [Halomonas urumqiensis]PTB02743.1 DNA-binding response regulator [Halomonas urumqiensis]GHE21242.1 helix-turn-helix transcriptional regulator [Halomonas urumqiensis]